MTLNEDYDFSVVEENVLSRASVTIHPAQDTGMLVLTDSSLYFLRNHNGKTFIAKIVWRREILSCTATSHMGSGVLYLNTARGELHFSGEVSALKRIADELAIQSKADFSSSTRGSVETSRVNTYKYGASKTTSPQRKSSSNIPWLKGCSIGLAVILGLVIVVSVCTSTDSDDESNPMRQIATVHSTSTPKPVYTTSTPIPTSTPSPTETPEPTKATFGCSSPWGKGYEKSILPEITAIGIAMTELGDHFYDLADNRYLAKDREWLSSVGITLSTLQFSAEDILDIDPPPFLRDVHDEMQVAAHLILQLERLIQEIIQDSDSYDMYVANNLLERIYLHINQGVQLAYEFCN